MENEKEKTVSTYPSSQGVRGDCAESTGFGADRAGVNPALSLCTCGAVGT